MPHSSEGITPITALGHSGSSSLWEDVWNGSHVMWTLLQINALLLLKGHRLKKSAQLPNGMVSYELVTVQQPLQAHVFSPMVCYFSNNLIYCFSSGACL